MSQSCVIFPSSYKDVRVSSPWDRLDSSAGRARMFDEEGLTVKMIAQTLSSSERLVLSLHYGEGLTASEIADVMETQPNTVEEVLAGVRERITAARLAILDSICG